MRALGRPPPPSRRLVECLHLLWRPSKSKSKMSQIRGSKRPSGQFRLSQGLLHRVCVHPTPRQRDGGARPCVRVCICAHAPKSTRKECIYPVSAPQSGTPKLILTLEPPSATVVDPLTARRFTTSPFWVPVFALDSRLKTRIVKDRCCYYQLVVLSRVGKTLCCCA